MYLKHPVWPAFLSPTSSLRNCFSWNYYSEIVFIPMYLFNICITYIYVYKQYISVCNFMIYRKWHISAACLFFPPSKLYFWEVSKGMCVAIYSFLKFLNRIPLHECTPVCLPSSWRTFCWFPMFCCCKIPCARTAGRASPCTYLSVSAV